MFKHNYINIGVRTNIPQIKAIYNVKTAWSVAEQYSYNNYCYDTNIHNVNNNVEHNPIFTKNENMAAFI